MVCQRSLVAEVTTPIRLFNQNKVRPNQSAVRLAPLVLHSLVLLFSSVRNHLRLARDTNRSQWVRPA